MHPWHYERLSELLGKLQARFPEPVLRELYQAVSAHSTRIAAPRPGREPPLSLSRWTEWNRPFDTVPGECIQGSISSPREVHCAAGSLVDGAIWAGGEVRVDQNGVIEGPVVSQEQIDWQGKRAQSLIAPRICLGRAAFPLELRGSILCQSLALSAETCISGKLGGSLVVAKEIVRLDDGQPARSLFVLSGTAAEGVDVPCAVTLDDRVQLGHLDARGNVVLGEGCEVETVSGESVVVGAGCTVSHVYARGTLVLGPDSKVRTAIAQGRITVDATARVEGDLIASACGEVEIGGTGWFADRRRQYRANVAALLDPGAKDGPRHGWAAVRYLPHSLYRQLEGLQGGWLAALWPVEDRSVDQGAGYPPADPSMGEPACQ